MSKYHYVFEYGTPDNPEKHHAGRFRNLFLVDGSQIKALTTIFCAGYGRRYREGKRGGQALEVFPRLVYFDKETNMFYRSLKVPRTSADAPRYKNVYVPCNGVLSVHEKSFTRAHDLDENALISLQDGKPISFFVGGTWYSGELFDLFADEYSLTKSPRKSPATHKVI